MLFYFFFFNFVVDFRFVCFFYICHKWKKKRRKRRFFRHFRFRFFFLVSTSSFHPTMVRHSTNWGLYYVGKIFFFHNSVSCSRAEYFFEKVFSFLISFFFDRRFLNLKKKLSFFATSKKKIYTQDFSCGNVPGLIQYNLLWSK